MATASLTALVLPEDAGYFDVGSTPGTAHPSFLLPLALLLANLLSMLPLSFLTSPSIHLPPTARWVFPSMKRLLPLLHRTAQIPPPPGSTDVSKDLDPTSWELCWSHRDRDCTYSFSINCRCFLNASRDLRLLCGWLSLPETPALALPPWGTPSPPSPAFSVKPLLSCQGMNPPAFAC